MKPKLLIREVFETQSMEPLEDLYLEHRKTFIKWLGDKFGASKEEAEDIYTDAFIALYENIISGKLSEKDLTVQLKTYLFSIARNKTLSQFRQAVRFQEFIKEVEAIERSFGNEESKVNEEMADSLYRVFMVCFQKLQSIQQELSTRFHYHKKKMKDIATELKYKNANSAKRAKNNCMNKLRECCAENMHTL